MTILDLLTHHPSSIIYCICSSVNPYFDLLSHSYRVVQVPFVMNWRTTKMQCSLFGKHCFILLHFVPHFSVFVSPVAAPTYLTLLAKYSSISSSRIAFIKSDIWCDLMTLTTSSGETPSSSSLCTLRI